MWTRLRHVARAALSRHERPCVPVQAAVYELKDRAGNVDKLHVLKHKHKGEHPLRVQAPAAAMRGLHI